MSKKLKLTRQVIIIQLENGTSQEIGAWVYDDCLAWHKGINGQWTLTHLPTGYRLADYHGKYGKIRQITKNLTLIVLDWQTTCHTRLTSLAKQCQEIIKDYE